MCLHCSQGFHDFGDFCAHANEHLLGIGSLFAEPEPSPNLRVSSRRLPRYKEEYEEEEEEQEMDQIDADNIFACVDLEMDCRNDSDAPSAPEESDVDDGEKSNQTESDESVPCTNDSIAKKLAKQHFELDGSPEAEEYSRYIYGTSQIRCIKGFYKCPKCDAYKTKRQAHIRRHIFSHLKRKIFNCKLCNIKLSNICHVQLHDRFHRGGKTKTKGPTKTVPVKLTPAKSNDNESTGIVEGNNQFYEAKALLRANGIDIKNTQEAVDYIRYLCGRRVTVKKDGKFICPTCTYTSAHPSKVKRHYTQHLKSRIFTCMKCSKQITSIDDCRKHMTLIHGEKMERFKFTSLEPEDANVEICEKCGAEIEESLVEGHMATHNNDAEN